MKKSNFLKSQAKKLAYMFGFICLLPSITAHAGAASSSTIGISGNFTSCEATVCKVTQLGPAGVLSGIAPPAYNKTANLPAFNQSVAIIPVQPTPTLTVSAKNIGSQVNSAGIQIDFVSAAADSSVQSANLTLMLNPPPPVMTSSPFPEPFLNISLSNVQSSSSFDEVFPGYINTTGAVSIGSLSIYGSLVNNEQLQFSGNPAVNQTLYQSDTVSIILNKQIVPVVISCTATAGCTETPTGITTQAIEINLNNASVQGHTVTGQIIIASTTAN